ncbi:MAG: hypothetical protein LBU47_03955 [Christensenellaceae bacterium]|nr:hypothetical protein [Christensenellaceae bacterium]
MGNLFACLYLGAFLFSGFVYARRLAPEIGLLAQTALSLSLALFLLMWLPALFALFLGFAVPAQLFALGLVFLPAALLVLIGLRGHGAQKAAACRSEALALAALLLPLLALCAYLLHTHVLRADASGALHTGQSGFGDMAMHLSFISSIARSGAFPPLYSIQSGSAMGYPFLCDSISSTFLVLGASLRLSYILPMLPALLAVFSFVYLLFEGWLQSRAAAILGFVLFFLGSGFGFAYFFDGSAADWPNFTRLFTAFYETPTNLIEQNMRWVNPIADMLLPQRATLFGWSILFPCLYLLQRALFSGERRHFLLLGLFAGGLPLIHTHSFLALGLFSLSGLIYALFRKKELLFPYLLLYGALALALSLPQLAAFTFAQASQGHFLTSHWNWGNLSDNIFWFYLKNMGLVFLCLPFALANARGKAWFFVFSLPIWLISELFLFQPNAYDNNKLLFIPYLLACGLTGDFLLLCWQKLAGLRLRAALAALVLCAGTLSGALTLAREVVSDYELFSAPQVRAARFAEGLLPRDAILLTGDEHNNAFAALSGLTIVQGSPSYLYFHGVYDQARARDVRLMLSSAQSLRELAPKYGVTHIVFSDYERAMGASDEVFQGLPLLYSEGGVRIYSFK